MNERKKILVDITYGMSFRNIVLNKRFWDFLTKEYDVDLVTPLNFKTSDLKDLGISNIINVSNNSLGFVRRKILSLNYKALHIKRLMDLSDFFLKQHHAWPLVSRFHQSMQDNDKMTIDLFFWPAIKRTFAGKHIKNLANFFPLFHPLDSILKKKKYEFLINTHSSEYASVLNSQVANNRNLPVICFPMGLDNIMHGPILFKPAKILFWGEDQEYEFNKFHKNWIEGFSEIQQGMLGSLIFDTLEDTKESININSFYGLKDTDKFLLFCTMPEVNHPGQIEICEEIILFLDLRKYKHKLIIRLRPGIDEPMWENFKAKHPGRVILQSPSGGSFDKSSLRKDMDIRVEIEDISIYASTIKSSSIVISRALSTSYTDALFLGTPAVIPQYYPLNINRTVGFRDMWEQICTVYPHHRKGYNFAFDNHAFVKYLESVLNNKNKIIKEITPGQDYLIKKQLHNSQKTAGERAIAEIQSFVSSISK